MQIPKDRNDSTTTMTNIKKSIDKMQQSRGSIFPVGLSKAQTFSPHHSPKIPIVRSTTNINSKLSGTQYQSLTDMDYFTQGQNPSTKIENLHQMLDDNVQNVSKPFLQRQQYDLLNKHKS